MSDLKQLLTGTGQKWDLRMLKVASGSFWLAPSWFLAVAKRLGKDKTKLRLGTGQNWDLGMLKSASSGFWLAPSQFLTDAKQLGKDKNLKQNWGQVQTGTY